MKTCNVAECDGSVKTRGMCGKHYQKFTKYGDPLMTVLKSPEVRFWERVKKTATCWNWTGSPMGNGYGHMYFGDRMIGAHRVSYELAFGPIPEGMVIDHICYNRKCVNTDHLQAVTQQQNIENRRGPVPGSKSGYRGVHWHEGAGKWVGRVGHGGRNYYVGLFTDPAEAAAACIAKRNELHTNNLMDRIAS